MSRNSLNPWNWFKHENEIQQKPSSTSMFPSFSQFPPFNDFQREMDRYFNQAFQNFGQFPTTTELPKAFSSFKPCTNIAEDANKYTIEVEIPGVDKKDVTLNVKDNVLTLTAEKRISKEDKDKNFHKIERSYGTLQRSFTLPNDCNPGDITADFKKGVLCVSIPRKSTPETETRKIDVRGED